MTVRIGLRELPGDRFRLLGVGQAIRTELRLQPGVLGEGKRQ
jgi:hypothetical protein